MLSKKIKIRVIFGSEYKKACFHKLFYIPLRS